MNQPIDTPPSPTTPIGHVPHPNNPLFRTYLTSISQHIDNERATCNIPKKTEKPVFSSRKRSRFGLKTTECEKQ